MAVNTQGGREERERRKEGREAGREAVRDCLPAALLYVRISSSPALLERLSAGDKESASPERSPQYPHS